MLVILLAFIPWLILLALHMYLMCQKRNSEFFAHRSIVIIVMTQLYVFISSVLVATSLLVPSINFCIVLNCIYSLALPTCILPLYLGIPGLIVRSELNKMMVSRSQGHHSWKWKLRYFYSVRVKLLIIAIASIVQLGIYFCFQYNFTLLGDCQRYSIFPFTIIQIFYFLPIIFIGLKIRDVNDPHSIRLEIVTTLILILPAVICLFFFLTDKLPFAFQYLYLYATVVILFSNLMLPVIILYKKKTNKKTSQGGSDIDISAILTGSDYESFVSHCIANLVTENVLFYQDVESYKIFQTSEKAQHIYEEYIEREAPLEINIDDNIARQIKLNLPNYPANLFDEAQFAVSVLLKIDVIPRWRRTSQQHDFPLS